MYSDTVTVFNRYVDSFKNTIWYPSVVRGVNLNIDKAAIIAKYGAESNDNAVLNIHYRKVENQIMVDGKPYLPPKEWERQTNDRLPESITFSSSSGFDFFIIGEYPDTEPILNDDYLDGFYNHLNDNYDFVFAITSVAQYSVIPHFEIMGA